MYIRMVDVLNRAHLGESTSVVTDVDREVKHVTISPHLVVLSRKGLLDDNDMLTLGDYGLDYSDGRWGLFARQMLRMMNVGISKERRAYFDTAMHILHPSVRITKVCLRPSAL